MSLIEIRSLVLGYDSASAAVEIEHLNIEAGELVALMGPNGAGKSTLLKAAAGLLRPLSGTVTVRLDPAKQVAYLAQRQEVDWQFPLHALDVVLMGRDVHLRWPRRPNGYDRDLAREALHQVGMSDYAARSIGELSGGQQQRVFLARALAQQASLLLLDEPFAGTDAASQEQIWSILHGLCRSGHTVILVTHESCHCHQVSSVALLRRRLLAWGPAAHVLSPQFLLKAYGPDTAWTGSPLEFSV